MEPTLIIAIATIAVGALLMAGCLTAGAVALVWLLRRSRRRASAARPASPDRALPPVPRRSPRTPIASAPSPTPAPPPPLGRLPPQAGGPGLLGMPDDTPSGDAKTELFQRGAAAFEAVSDDDPELDEVDATEIFSAHGPAGDLSEFALDHTPDATGHHRVAPRK